MIPTSIILRLDCVTLSEILALNAPPMYSWVYGRQMGPEFETDWDKAALPPAFAELCEAIEPIFVKIAPMVRWTDPVLSDVDIRHIGHIELCVIYFQLMRVATGAQTLNGFLSAFLLGDSSIRRNTGFSVHKKNARRSQNGFYRSVVWGSLRDKVLQFYGTACMKCGTDDGASARVDHILPRLKFAELHLHPDNMQVLCRQCNLTKGDRDYSDYRLHERRAEFAKVHGIEMLDIASFDSLDDED